MKNLIFFLLPVLVILVTPVTIAQTTFTVTDPGDEEDPDLTDSIYFPPTLRSAIQNANIGNDLNLINFTETALFIQPNSGLFIITNPVIIDGNVNDSSVTLDGSNISGGSAGLHLWDPNPNNPDIGAHNSKIQNMMIVNFPGNGVIVEDVSAIEIIGNIISGNGTNSGGGINIRGNDINDVENILVKNNRVGTDKAGMIAVPNQGGGIVIEDGTVITIVKNLISGNLEDGISIGTNVVDVVIDSNLIGSDKTGTALLGNGGSGIINNATAVLITDNLIGGSNFSGINLQSGSATILGNIIGTNSDGDNLPNRNGISIAGPNNIVGGVLAQDQNIISDNTFRGITILSNQATGNQILNNKIGTDITGLFNDGNGTDGLAILTGASDNNIQDNTIAFNGSNGVMINDDNSLRNTLYKNNIYLNEELGIDIGDDGVTGNDLQDVDTGPNQKQNYPVILLAVGDTIKGSLNSTPLTGFDIDFFTNTECDLSLYGEGEAYLQSTFVNTDANGNGFFNVTTVRTIQPEEFVTATATDPNGNTSEFCLCFGVATDLAITVTDNLDSVMVTDTLTYTLCATNKGPFTGTNVVIKDTLPSQLSYISHSSTHGTSTYIGGVLECNIDTLFKDDTVYVYLEAEVISSNPALIENIVTVNGEELDYLPQNNRAIDTTRIAGATDISEPEEFPSGFVIEQNYPNPFNPTTIIEYNLPEYGYVTLKVYDLLGNEIVTLVNEEKSAGNHKIDFDGRDLVSGIYYYQLNVGNEFVETRKMVLLK